MEDVPGVGNEEIERWCKEILSVEDEGEDEIAGKLGVTLPVFPRVGSEHEHLARKNKRPFGATSELLPAVAASLQPDSLLPRIRGPVPDITYGIKPSAFNTPQEICHNQPPLNEIHQPIADLYWPFLAVEIKSQAKGGSLYVATNQCAGSGSACVKAMDILSTDYPLSNDTPLLAFSCAVDGGTAKLYVHWQSSPGEFHLATIQRYLLSDPQYLHDLYRHVYSIIHWGTHERLSYIRRVLDARSAARLQESPAH
ncbi:hypothetical protein B0A49_12968 [Cryomyces minteri]|uniref:DUF7924 domain-containing protein n=1 Tax=Cryomyces minteri TaxID=331657 RepID=A0A4U0WNS1_9PEZI|nr:hypothetical protein B0A49_12968 [Cryomyces minteri]